MPRVLIPLMLPLVIASPIVAGKSCSSILSWAELTALPAPAPGLLIAYGDDPLQHGELRLPEGAGPHPVVLVIHGGCWRARYDLAHIRPLSAALAREGFATWTPEYRRVGDAGGGWPGTFLDVAAAADALLDLEESHSLDLSRVVALGHSAGGHLALWLAARPGIAKESVLHSESPLPVAGIVSLAGIPDLELAAREGICGDGVPALLGGDPIELQKRVAQTSPARLLPLGVPQVLLSGDCDEIVPLLAARSYLDTARASNDEVELQVLPDAGHFELVSPASHAWPSVLAAVRKLATSS